MNKKEVSEIKRLFNKNKCHVRKLCGCYVDAEKNIKTEVKHAFLSLDEEEMFKYINIFRSCLSGSLGRNLINLEFPIEQEETGGTQEFLLRLRDSRLEDDELIEQFYNKVIEYYEYAENYYIILAHAAYDIPGITSDGLEMDDASIYVYEHLICCICPVKLEKSNLSTYLHMDFYSLHLTTAIRTYIQCCTIQEKVRILILLLWIICLHADALLRAKNKTAHFRQLLSSHSATIAVLKP